MHNKPELLFQKKVKNDLIEVWQHGEHRWLSINTIEQTRINCKHPEQLASPVYHAFLAVLLFIDTPSTVMLAGLGGGAIARYIYQKNSNIEGEAIEINPTVAELAKKHFEFPATRWNLIIDDVRRWQGYHYDLILLDIAEADITPEWLTSETMLLHLKQQLSPSGVLVINILVTDAQSFSQILKLIRKIFERRTLCLSVPDHKNIVVFAFNQQPRYRTQKELETRVSGAIKIWGIDFKKQLEQLQKDNPAGSGIF